MTPERPILFSAPMVRAILAGRKTQTRRIVKPVRGFEHNNILKYGMPHAAYSWAVWWHGVETDRVGCLHECPYGKPGDRLWVRETWMPFELCYEDLKPSDLPQSAQIVYLADQKQKLSGDRYRPSIFMPRWASRITLEVTGVRAERLQDISEEDALAEGIEPFGLSGRHWRDYGLSRPGAVGCLADPRDCYASLWESINGPGSWASNPWVWVVEFRPDVTADSGVWQ